MMDVKVTAIDESLQDAKIKATPGGLLYTLPQSVIWTAKGYGRQIMATAAVAALVVRPTTVAMATLFNNSGNKNYVIDRAFAHNLVGAANSVYGLWLCVHPVGMTAPTNDITTARSSTNGGAANADGIFDNGATVLDNGWFPWGKSGHTVTVTTPGEQLEVDIAGRIILPPTAAISLHVVADVTGATFTAGFHWYAVPESELAIN